MKSDALCRIGKLISASSLYLLAAPTWSQDSLAEMDKAFQALQSGVAAVEKKRTITTAVDIDAALDDYVQKAWAAYQEVVGAVEKDAKSANDTGARKRLLAFETKIKQHKVAVDRMGPRLATIGTRVRRGEIRLDPAVLKQATPDDIKDLSQWLTPLQRKNYQKLDPRISAAPYPALALGTGQLHRKVEEIADQCSQSGSLRAAAQRGLDLLIPDAHASLAGGCYVVCAASLGFGCITCVLSAGGAALSAYNEYVKQRNGCSACKWYKPWGCVCRAAVAAAFLAALA